MRNYPNSNGWSGAYYMNYTAFLFSGSPRESPKKSVLQRPYTGISASFWKTEFSLSSLDEQKWKLCVISSYSKSAITMHSKSVQCDQWVTAVIYSGSVQSCTVGQYNHVQWVIAALYSESVQTCTVSQYNHVQWVSTTWPVSHCSLIQWVKSQYNHIQKVSTISPVSHCSHVQWVSTIM